MTPTTQNLNSKLPPRAATKPSVRVAAIATQSAHNTASPVRMNARPTGYAGGGYCVDC